VPIGYTSNQLDCVDVALGGSCEITNPLNGNTIVVNKDFLPNSVATVPVVLTCTSGTVTTSRLNASEASPAVFTVTGASPGATCTATETVPAGYTGNRTDCVDVAGEPAAELGEVAGERIRHVGPVVQAADREVVAWPHFLLEQADGGLERGGETLLHRGRGVEENGAADRPCVDRGSSPPPRR
jgi:hypothetical protein